MNNNNYNVCNAQSPLNMHFESFQFFSNFLILFLSFWINYNVICFIVLVVIFVCSWIGCLFTNYMMSFVTLSGRKQCGPLHILFRDGADVISYLIMDKHRSSNIERNNYWLHTWFGLGLWLIFLHNVHKLRITSLSFSNYWYCLICHFENLYILNSWQSPLFLTT